jgi:hypothetical protein
MSHSIRHEDDIPVIYDEHEPGEDELGLVMRTIVDFELFSAQGCLVSVDDLGKSGETATLVGYIVQPLQADIKESMINLLCTSSQHLPSEAELAKLLPIAQKRRKSCSKSKAIDEVDGDAYSDSQVGQAHTEELSVLLDHKNLKIGDNIDGYCVKTYRWYEAKVVDMKKGDDDEDVKLRIHFSGWNSKHDEWIPRESGRIAARGSSSSIVLAAAKTASSLVPWWNAEVALSRAKVMLGYQDGNQNPNGKILPERQRMPVRIEGIEDWCIDYTYANPNLWLIAASGVWYRVAGPLCVNSLKGRINAHKGFPSKRYTDVFTKSCSSFLSSVHVAICLIDFLPSIPKLSLEYLSEEVSARSNMEVDELDILQNYLFIAGRKRNLL